MATVAPQLGLQAEKGSPHPLGATPDQDGVNFSLFSKNATAVDLLLFKTHNDRNPFQVIQLDPFVNKTFHFWHCYVRGLRPGTHYAYRVDGPSDLSAGHRFNNKKVLIDPYAKGNSNSLWKRVDACGPHDNLASSMRSIVIDSSTYGIDNGVYYFLSPSDKQFYFDYSGCGNTFNCNQPISQKLIIECLRYWVRETHVDGFRFDEGSVLSRGEDGVPLAHPPVVWQIELDETLADSKVIAEAWDAAGLYQIGHFPGDRWAEWNGRYRDDVRRFVKGDPGFVGAVAYRLAGSSDLYEERGQLPVNSINFITCHDGFTLNDLVSYNTKHNEENGEDNRDGINDNLSWNCGIEGGTTDPAVEALRNRQIKNFAVILLLSRGVPMILAGDEVRRSQKGNNNAYCQDNEISWFDWNLTATNQDMYRFWRRMIEFRKNHPPLRRRHFFNGAMNERGLADVSWHGCKLNCPGWSDPEARALGVTLGGFNGEADIHVMLNMYSGALDFEVPLLTDRLWFKAIDSAEPSPYDIVDPGSETEFGGNLCSVQGRSVVVLISR